MNETVKNFELLDFSAMAGIACPCGTARRGLLDVPSVPYSLHVTEISVNAKVHYHKLLTETYFILECESDAYLELDGAHVPVRPHSAVVIHPGTRHRAVGKMKVVIVASPKFDPSDEWLD
jgi:mannose-6-phosphate isomerase-like protein (cupin superfamily)